MWLHVPSLQASLSAQGSADSTLESMQSLDLELFATSSGKPTLRPCSWRGWKTRRWILLLYGTISRPSMASRGVAEWISSMPGTHASPSPRQGTERAKPTPDTSGPMSPESSEKLLQGLLFSKTSEDMSASVSEKSSKTFMAWGSMRNGEFIALPMPVRPIEGSDCSSWPTPTARDHKSGKASEETHSRNSRPLSEVVGRLAQKMTGQESRPNSGLRLNPLFVEWLMLGSLRIGWTDFEPLATPFAANKPSLP